MGRGAVARIGAAKPPQGAKDKPDKRLLRLARTRLLRHILDDLPFIWEQARAVLSGSEVARTDAAPLGRAAQEARVKLVMKILDKILLESREMIYEEPPGKQAPITFHLHGVSRGTIEARKAGQSAVVELGEPDIKRVEAPP